MDQKTIYLAQAENTNNYKIGITRQDPKNRLRQLQTGNSCKLVLISKFETKYGNKMEIALHSRFKTKKREGEWFNLQEEDLKQFHELCMQIEKNFDTLAESNYFFRKSIA